MSPKRVTTARTCSPTISGVNIQFIRYSRPQCDIHNQQ